MKHQNANMFRIMLLFLAILFIGLLSASITHAETYSFVTKWGSSGSSNGQFYSPLGVAVDSSRNVYVVDEDSRIQKFDSNGNFITKWNGQFYHPRDIAIDSSSNVYVVDSANRRIQKFDSNGNFITKWGSNGYGDGQFSDPQGIAVGSLGNVYVSDKYNRIQKFDSNGKFIAKWGSRGTDHGQFDCPLGVAIDSSGNVYVADSNNRRIQKFDSNGNFLTELGVAGIGDGQFSLPTDIAIDSSNNIYVSDIGAYRIQKFDSNGNFITKWGSRGTGDGQFDAPWYIAVDSLGNVYVTEMQNDRVQKFAPTKPVLPVSNFSSNVTSGITPLNVAFTDRSTGTPTSWNWTFGDGTYSTAKNVTHTYSKAGNYTVYLKVSNSAGSNTTTKTNYIKVTSATKPVANFTGNVTSGNAPLTVSFTDKSTNNPTSWKWIFGDGTNSTVKNPIHRYSTKGNYTVTLTASNSAGSNTTTKTSYIKVTSVPRPVANFTSNVTSGGNAPLIVLFTDKSTNTPTSWRWTFGDGTNSTVKNPVHKYSVKGNYTVSLTATNAAGSNTTTKTNYIKVTAVVKPVANFTSNVTSGYVPLSVAFADKSTNIPTSWRWTFGDGTNSTVKNPVHRYSTAGNYTVTLTANNSAGSSTTTKANYIKVIKK